MNVCTCWADKKRMRRVRQQTVTGFVHVRERFDQMQTHTVTQLKQRFSNNFFLGFPQLNLEVVTMMLIYSNTQTNNEQRSELSCDRQTDRLTNWRCPKLDLTELASVLSNCCRLHCKKMPSAFPWLQVFLFIDVLPTWKSLTADTSSSKYKVKIRLQVMVYWGPKKSAQFDQFGC